MQDGDGHQAAIGSWGCSITINGGNISSFRASGAAIGGDNSTVTINSGTIYAQGMRAIKGTFSATGNAFIVADYIGDQSYKTNEMTSGVIIEGNIGSVYGNPTLSADATIPVNTLLEVPEGATLTIPEGVTLTNNGIIIENGRNAICTNAEFDVGNKNIVTSDKGLASLRDLIGLPWDYSFIATASLSAGATKRYGTGSVVNFCDKRFDTIYTMTLVVTFDINGDSYVDVLDVALLERAVNGHTDIGSLSQYAFAAADGCKNNAIDIDDYSAIVNAALQ